MGATPSDDGAQDDGQQPPPDTSANPNAQQSLADTLPETLPPQPVAPEGTQQEILEDDSFFTGAEAARLEQDQVRRARPEDLPLPQMEYSIARQTSS